MVPAVASFVASTLPAFALASGFTGLEVTTIFDRGGMMAAIDPDGSVLRCDRSAPDHLSTDVKLGFWIAWLTAMSFRTGGIHR